MPHVARTLAIAAAAALSACGQPAEAPAASPSAAATAGVMARRVAALAPGQREGVLLRAIRDAGHQGCQQVTGAEQVPEAPEAWIAACEDGAHWLVTFRDDGTATVTGGAARPVTG